MSIVDLYQLDQNNFVWQDLASCLGAPGELFFEVSEKKPAVQKAIEAMCETCPAKEICLSEAKRNSDFGIRGGKRLEGGKVVS